jgi:hypothetical protein
MTPAEPAKSRPEKNDQLGCVEVRVIEDVEGLYPELQIQALLQRNPLEQRGGQVDVTWSYKGTARATFPKLPAGGSKNALGSK